MLTIPKGSGTPVQLPEPRQFVSDPRWPSDIAQLFDEAARAYAARAFTSAAMTARKILMACAVEQGDDDGKNFTNYVDFIVNNILTYPKARASIDRIRKIGNDATHKIIFVSKDDAERAMSIISYMLDAIYSLPTM